MKHKEAEMIKGQPPYPDDSWWEAVLADEEKHVEGVNQAATLKGREEKRQGSEEEIDWVRVRRFEEDEEALECTVVSYNRGGLLVEGEGFHGFVPVSHLVDFNAMEEAEGREPCLLGYVGQTVLLKVIECDPQRGRVVLSERAAQTAPGERQRLFSTLQTGDKTSGKVTNVTDFGVFVDLGGVEGLVHISELSWGRVGHPKDLVDLGSEVEVLVLKVDCDRGRVALSMKRLHPNPWETAGERYPPGALAEVQITDVVKFGAFARLEEGLEGLIHISQMGYDGAVDPEDMIYKGEHLKVRVLHVDAGRQRMSLQLVHDEELQRLEVGGDGLGPTEEIDGEEKGNS